MVKKTLPHLATITAISASTLSMITKEDLIFILSLLITLINAILEYLRNKRNAKNNEET